MTVMDTQPILFIQGAGNMREPDSSGRLATYLASELGSSYRVIAPEMPDADAPRYQPWRDRIEQELEAIDEDVIVVGHSFGGSVVLKYFAEGSYHGPVRGMFLISVPDWGPDGWAYEEFAVPDDVGSQLPTSRIFLYHSRDDPEVPFAHLAHYQQHLPTATARAIAGSEHSFIEGLPVLADDIRRLRL
jgi:predicted alpha/beta hydrolase family esterase